MIGRSRAFAFTTATLFAISWMFPLGAGLAKVNAVFPKWWGPADVALAFVLVILAFTLQSLVHTKIDKQAEETTYRFYRIFTHVLMAVAAIVMLAGDRIVWANCATGFLWRTWLLLYVLPWWLTAARPR